MTILPAHPVTGRRAQRIEARARRMLRNVRKWLRERRKEHKMPKRRWEWAVLQTFRDGRERVVTTRGTKADANVAAEQIAEDHARIHGHARTRVKRQARRGRTGRKGT